MKVCGVETAHTLHITSWDADHCSETELDELLTLSRPIRIECPGYDPHTFTGKTSLGLIKRYREKQNRPVQIQQITPAYINTLPRAEGLAFRDVLYNPRIIDNDCANNNSTVQLFRKGSFNVLSLGDVESVNISAYLRRCRILKRETDVMILAHHGADNGFTNKSFLERVEPHLAICSANYDNQHEHPRQEIRDLLYEHGIKIMTTKTGDVIVKSIGDHTGQYRAVNLKANSTEISSQYDFTSKKVRLLSFNPDTLRELYRPRPTYPR
jgi:competence protein ComEC